MTWLWARAKTSAPSDRRGTPSGVTWNALRSPPSRRPTLRPWSATRDNLRISPDSRRGLCHRIRLPRQSLLPRTAHTQRLEDSRMNIVGLVIVIVAAYWLSSLVID